MNILRGTQVHGNFKKSFQTFFHGFGFSVLRQCGQGTKFATYFSKAKEFVFQFFFALSVGSTFLGCFLANFDFLLIGEKGSPVDHGTKRKDGDVLCLCGWQRVGHCGGAEVGVV